MSNPALTPIDDHRILTRHRPILPPLMGIIVGIFIQSQVIASPVLLFGIFLIALSVCLISLRQDKKAVLWLASGLLFLPVGALNFNLRYQSLPPHHIKNILESHEGLIRLRARVVGPPIPIRSRHPFADFRSYGPSRWSLRLQMKQIQLKPDMWIRTGGGLTVFGSGDMPSVRYGDFIESMGYLSANSPPTNPGEPALNEKYEAAGYYGIMTGVVADGIEVISESRWFYDPRILIESFRVHVRNKLDSYARANTLHPLVKSLILGDRFALPSQLSDDLQNVGAIHFLAISGLHVGIFAAGCWLIISLFGISSGKRNLILIVLVWLYVLFTGSRVSSLRAALMVSAVIGAPLLHRRADPLSSVAGAAFILLLWRPQDIFSVGFHFSFLAVWALFYIAPDLYRIIWPWRELTDKLQDAGEVHIFGDLSKKAGQYFVLSLSVWLTLMPLRVWNFNRYSLLLPVINIFLWPLVLFLLLNCFISLPVLFVNATLFSLTNRLSSVLSWGIDSLLSVSRSWPGFVRYTPAPPMWWIGLYYLVLISWVKIRSKPLRAKVLVYGVVMLVGSLLIYEVRTSRPEYFRIVVKDVGHGQSILFASPEGGVKLYDSGSVSYRYLNAVTGVLWHNRIRHINALTVSHRHFDHYAFVPKLHEKFGISRLLIPPKARGEHVPSALHNVLFNSTDEYIRVKERTKLSDGFLRGVFKHPDIRFLSESEVERNDLSAVLLCEYDNWHILLPGDAENKAMRHLITQYGSELRADVLILPHHGAWEPVLEEFIRAVDPKIAIASSGRSLNTSTVRTLDSLGIPLWSTYNEGAVTLEFQNDGIHVRGFKSGRYQLITGNNRSM